MECCSQPTVTSSHILLHWKHFCYGLLTFHTSLIPSTEKNIKKSNITITLIKGVSLIWQTLVGFLSSSCFIASKSWPGLYDYLTSVSSLRFAPIIFCHSWNASLFIAILHKNFCQLFLFVWQLHHCTV